MLNLVYDRLRAHLDKPPGRFPKTDSGVEMAIFKPKTHPFNLKLDISLDLGGIKNEMSKMLGVK